MYAERSCVLRSGCRLYILNMTNSTMPERFSVNNIEHKHLRSDSSKKQIWKLQLSCIYFYAAFPWWWLFIDHSKHTLHFGTSHTKSSLTITYFIFLVCTHQLVQSVDTKWCDGASMMMTFYWSQQAYLAFWYITYKIIINHYLLYFSCMYPPIGAKRRYKVMWWSGGEVDQYGR
jgi:hypothetical protein